MDELERRIQATLMEREHDVRGGLDVAGLSLTRLRSERRRLRVVLAASGALALVVVVVAMVAMGPTRPSTEDEHDRLGSLRPVPAGMQAVSFHGLEIAVPASWKLNDTHCGTPQSDTAVIMDGSPIAACLVQERPGLTVARMDLLESPDGRALDRLATTWVTLDGHRARRGHGHAFGYASPFDVLSVPDVGVVASVRSPDAELSPAILATAAVVPIDSAGCADHVDALWPDRGPTRTQGQPRLVPGAPVAATVCRYADLWLNRSVVVSDADRDHLLTTLNSLQEVESAEAPEDCSADAGRGFVLRFRYEEGPAVDVFVHVSPCDLRVTNGSRSASADLPLIDEVTTLAGYDGSLPDPSQLP